MFELYPKTHYLQIRNSSMIYYSVADKDVFAPTGKRKEFGKTYCAEDEYNEGESEIEKTNVETYSGVVTKGACKRIRIAVDIMLQITKPIKIYNPIIQKEVDFKLSFITLTISDNSRFISGAECYKTCLKPFLDWLRRTQKCNTYIWKAERQKQLDANGNIKLSNGQLHYHLTCNSFILHDVLRKKWNSLQKTAGYLEDYAIKFKNYNPNSTDIHSVHKVKNLEAYLVKYISKDAIQLETETTEEFNNRVSVDGKVWDCSSNLRGVKFFKVEYNDLTHLKLTKDSNNNKLKKIPIDFCDFYVCNDSKPTDYLEANDWLDYCMYKNKIINNGQKND